jgi:hypothetical protein
MIPLFVGDIYCDHLDPNDAEVADGGSLASKDIYKDEV